MFITILKATRNSLLNRRVALDFYNGEEMHKWMIGRQNCNRKNGNLLYRIIETKDEIYIYLYSKDKFNTEGIEAVGLQEVAHRTIQDNDIDALTAYQITFDTLVIPQKTVSPNKKGFIQDRDDRRAWLTRQFEKHGVSIVQANEYAVKTIAFSRTPKETTNDNNSGKTKHVNCKAVCFRGTAIINNVQQFMNLIENGIGGCKNFGAGMVLFK